MRARLQDRLQREAGIPNPMLPGVSYVTLGASGQLLVPGLHESSASHAGAARRRPSPNGCDGQSAAFTSAT